MNGEVIPLMTAAVQRGCLVDPAESFSSHAQRCDCDFMATVWAHFADTAKAKQPEEDPQVWAATADSAGAYIADAVAEAFAALNRVIRLGDAARGHLAERDGLHALTAALDDYLTEPDLLVTRAADARRVITDILYEDGAL